MTVADSRDQVVEIFRSLEFRSLLSRLPEMPSDDTTEEAPPVSSGRLSESKVVVGENELRALAEEIANAPVVAFDVETDGLNPLHSRLVGLALATSPFMASRVETKLPHCWSMRWALSAIAVVSSSMPETA